MRVNPRSVKERVFATSQMMGIREVFLRVSETSSHMQKRELGGLDSNSTRKFFEGGRKDAWTKAERFTLSISFGG